MRDVEDGNKNYRTEGREANGVPQVGWQSGIIEVDFKCGLGVNTLGWVEECRECMR